jgi:hypothetical protein
MMDPPLFAYARRVRIRRFGLATTVLVRFGSGLITKSCEVHRELHSVVFGRSVRILYYYSSIIYHQYAVSRSLVRLTYGRINSLCYSTVQYR